MAQQNRPYGLRTLALDVAVLVLFWLLGFALVQAAQRVTDAWAVRDIGQLIAEVVSLGLAVRLRARIAAFLTAGFAQPAPDRKSTRLNSSHQIISYAVFCLK